MIVFGDHDRAEDPRRLLAAARRLAEEAREAPPGVARHDLLVATLIEAGQAAQGLADAEREATGRDGRSPLQDAAMALVLALARQVGASWQGDPASPAPLDAAFEALDALPLPGRVTVRQPEGFAHYALYPEAYWEAGRSLPPQARIIGLRSIGTSLAAMAAAGAGAGAPITLRPVGPPFRRRFDLAPGLLAGCLDDAAPVAIVDEGPGLSGSSMNGLADLLEGEGVAPERIVFLPGHDGALGPEAAPRHVRRWAGADRRVVPFDALIAPRLAAAVEDLTGPARAPLDDLSGGAWRGRRFPAEADWPPVDAMRERRKFLLRSGSGPWLLKFVGLGRLGAEAFARAARLHGAGVAPRPLGVRLGFLVERWHADAAPPDPSGGGRAAFIETVGRYLGLRFGPDAGEGSGALPAALAEMAWANIREALGQGAAEAWRRRYGDGSGLPPPARVPTDSRLHAWEWLRLPDGRVLKADALDHHRAHDLVGCQDIAWDIVGAGVELRCSPGEVRRLVETVERAGGRAVDPAWLRWLAPVYLAFQVGLWSMAGAASGGAETARIEALLAAYRAALLRLIEA